MPTYNCSNCGEQFKGSEFLDECPSCSSENFGKVDPPAIAFLKKAYPFIIILAIIGIAFSYLLPLLDSEANKGSESSNKADNTGSISYELAFEKSEQGIAIKLEKWQELKSGYNVTAFDEAKAASLIEKMNFRAKDNMGRDVTLKNGIFYPCPNDKTDTLVIEWDEKADYPIKDRNSNKAVKYFTLKAEEPDTDANCTSPRPALKIMDVGFSASNCIINVQTNRSEEDEVKVSVTGKHGNYKAKNTWQASDLDKFDVWVSSGKDTVGYKLNGNPIGECVDCNQAKMNKMRSTIKNVGNAYGKHPNDLSALSAFKKQIDAGFTNFYVDGKALGGWSDFYNKVKLRYENQGNQYKVKEVKVNNCKVKTIKFVSKNT